MVITVIVIKTVLIIVKIITKILIYSTILKILLKSEHFYNTVNIYQVTILFNSFKYN